MDGRRNTGELKMVQLTPHQITDLCAKVEKLSREIGSFILNERVTFTRDNIQHKGFNDLVSYVDKEAEKQFVAALKKLLPEAGILAEEGTGTPQPNGLNWIIDPLDGTTNFIHNIPFYCTSVALVAGKKPLLGVIYNPSGDEMFTAVSGPAKFAHLNGAAIEVSPVNDPTRMLMAIGFPYQEHGLLEKHLDAIGQLTLESRGIRRLGSAALDLCYVACGRLDGFYEYGLSPWDVAAGQCIVEEAGGLVDDFKQGNNPIFSKEIIAASPAAFELLRNIVARHF